MNDTTTGFSIQALGSQARQAARVLRSASGAAKAAKRGAEREASAGLVAQHGSAIVELNSETDFVAKNDQFIALAEQLAKLAYGQTVAEAVSGLAAVIGEKIELGRVAAFAGERQASAPARNAANAAPTSGPKTGTHE